MIAYPHPPLSDSTILLRPWTVQDLPAVELASYDPYIAAATSVPSPYTHVEGLEWLKRQQQHVFAGIGLPFCVVNAQTNEPLGFIALWLHNRSLGRVHFGYWVIPKARGRGIASMALRLLSNWTLEHFAMMRLELWTEGWNIASQRVAEQAGFTREGVLHSYIEVAGTRRDVVMYVRMLSL